MSTGLQPRMLFQEEAMQIPQTTPAVAVNPERHFGNNVAAEGQDIECRCGGGKLKIIISHTSKNPNRPFYKCHKCGYFKWCDELGEASQNQSPKIPLKTSPLKSDHPICSCKAGNCTINMMPSGVHKGHKYYACFIKKGQGACDHFVWVDNITQVSETENDASLNNNNNNNNNNNLIPNLTMENPNQSSPPYESVKDLFSEKDMNTIYFWRNDQDAPGKVITAENDQNVPNKVITGEMQGTKESSPVKRANDNNYAIAETSPMKRLNLNGEISQNGGTNLQKRTGKCFKCEKEGHWASECTSYTGTGIGSKCFKCGKIGHWVKDCTASA